MILAAKELTLSLLFIFYSLWLPYSVIAEGLEYDANNRNVVPLPPAEKGLATAVATHLRKISEHSNGLEGATYDRDGNLYFCESGTNRILKLDSGNHLETVIQFNEFMPAGLAFHPDGRLFVAGIMDGLSRGAIYAISRDDKEREIIIPAEAGFVPNDLAINSSGGIYFTDFKGDMTNPAGGLYYISPDLKNVSKLVSNVANANGIAISPDEKTLWLGDYGRSILYRIELEDETHFDRVHSTPVYYFTGRGPDGIRTDSDGNAYVAMMSQGRVLVFNPRGLPIGQILLPGREEGRNLYSSSLAIKPGARDMAIVARGTDGDGSNIFKTHAFAKGNMNRAFYKEKMK